MNLKLTNLIFACLLLSSCHSKHTSVGTGAKPVKDSLSGKQELSASVEKEGNSLTIGEPIEKNIEPSLSKSRLVEFNSNFSNFKEYKENLNKYMIHAEFGKIDLEKVLLCDTQAPIINTKHFEIAIAKGEGHADLVVDLSGSNDIEVALNCRVKVQGRVLINSEFLIKKDVLIAQSSVYPQLKFVAGINKVGALVLDENVMLETNGDNITFIAEELISKNAMITTFGQATNLRAVNHFDGKSGGILNINAEKAYGSLLVKMQGQNGGEETYKPERITEVPVADSSLDSDFPAVFTNGICKLDAKKGYKGFRGLNGLPGRNGGRSGVANVTVGDGTDFRLEMKLVSGTGGLGGRPGEGGTGSRGGRGNNDNVGSMTCNNQRPTLDGPQGDNGDSGDAGAPGVDGVIERASYFDLKNNIRIEY